MRASVEDGSASGISVVVPVRDGAEVLGACLDGLMAAGVSPGAVTVVDDGSNDGGAAVARRRGIEPLRLSEPSGAAAARNAGAAATDGAVLLFVDADVVVHPDAVRIVARAFAEDPGLDAIFGAYDAFPADPGRVSRIRNLLHRHVHIEGAGPATTFWTGLGAVRRDAFDAVGGFDPGQRMMEDVAFGLSLTQAGRSIRQLPALQGTHLKGWTWASMARTDLFDRAIPWTRLLRDHAAGDRGRVLNVGRAGRISVVSVAASLAGVLCLPVAPLPGAGMIAAALTSLARANAPFLRRLAREGRPGDFVAAIPVLWVHYLCGGLGFARVRILG